MKKNIFKGYTWLHTRLALTVENSLNCVRIPFTSTSRAGMHFAKNLQIKLKIFRSSLRGGGGGWVGSTSMINQFKNKPKIQRILLNIG